MLIVHYYGIFALIRRFVILHKKSKSAASVILTALLILEQVQQLVEHPFEREKQDGEHRSNTPLDELKSGLDQP
jgi:hypothetical protein